jgi:hypothetical protein
VLTQEEMIVLLAGADTSWLSVRAVARQWQRHDLVTAAFDQHVAALRAAEGTAVFSVQVDGGGEPDPIIELVLAVATDQHGRRRRADVLSRRNDSWLFDTLVVDGDSFWARTGSAVQSNNGDPASSHGGADIVSLLMPSAVPGGFDLAVTSEEKVIAGRRCAVVEASPRPYQPHTFGRMPGSEAFHMIAGGTDFRLSVDLDTGVLLRVVKFVGGETAEVSEFSSISFDEVLDEAIFAPLVTSP